MAKIAVILAGGKQYVVSAGQELKIEKIEKEVGDKIKLEALLVADDAKVSLGKPSLGEKVEAEVVEQGRSKKVSVMKFKSKVRYRRNVGHHQAFTKVKINSIA
ncbi:MAG: 50S ribosomal protein L21 [Patescibacteria group bacterium]|jgi:large subunit ribosomal protein L21